MLQDNTRFNFVGVLSALAATACGRPFKVAKCDIELVRRGLWECGYSSSSNSYLVRVMTDELDSGLF